MLLQTSRALRTAPILKTQSVTTTSGRAAWGRTRRLRTRLFRQTRITGLGFRARRGGWLYVMRSHDVYVLHLLGTISATVAMYCS
jgi:hypothetical protein